MAEDATLSAYLQGFVMYLLLFNHLQDWLHILSDPDPAELQRMIRVGEMVTWPKVSHHS